ncbi:MAG: SUKH-3 domain-containing protein [Chloroflexi bacterium]|nr:SUKH-3 domain-containing protein [Chloroflexota bacterium]
MPNDSLNIQLTPIAATCYQLFGWTPTRQVDPSAHIAAIRQANYPCFPLAEAFLTSFGGLTTQIAVPPADENPLYYHHRIPYIFDRNRLFEDFIPANAQHCDDDAAPYWLEHPFIKRQQRQICPIGSYDNDATILLSADGLILLGKFYGVPGEHSREPMLRLVGQTLSGGLNRLIEQAIYYYYP